MNFELWAPGQPDVNNSPNEDCLGMNFGSKCFYNISLVEHFTVARVHRFSRECGVIFNIEITASRTGTVP